MSIFLFFKPSSTIRIKNQSLLLIGPKIPTYFILKTLNNNSLYTTIRKNKYKLYRHNVINNIKLTLNL